MFLALIRRCGALTLSHWVLLVRIFHHLTIHRTVCLQPSRVDFCLIIFTYVLILGLLCPMVIDNSIQGISHFCTNPRDHKTSSTPWLDSGILSVILTSCCWFCAIEPGLRFCPLRSEPCTAVRLANGLASHYLQVTVRIGLEHVLRSVSLFGLSFKRIKKLLVLFVLLKVVAELLLFLSQLD